MFARGLASTVDVCGATHPLHGLATRSILWQDMIATIEDPDGYGVWHVPVIAAQVG